MLSESAAAPPGEAVVAEAAGQLVAALLAEQTVIAQPAGDAVRTSVAVEAVLAAPTVDVVVAAPRHDPIGAVGAGEPVGSIGADHHEPRAGSTQAPALRQRAVVRLPAGLEQRDHRAAGGSLERGADHDHAAWNARLVDDADVARYVVGRARGAYLRPAAADLAGVTGRGGLAEHELRGTDVQDERATRRAVELVGADPHGADGLIERAGRRSRSLECPRPRGRPRARSRTPTTRHCCTRRIGWT